MKNKIKSAISLLLYKVWHNPKGKLTAKIKRACDDMPHKRRLTVVTLLLSAFVILAFFVFGHACYQMGSGHARQEIKVEHIRQLEISNNSVSHETD